MRGGGMSKNKNINQDIRHVSMRLDSSDPCRAASLPPCGLGTDTGIPALRDVSGTGPEETIQGVSYIGAPRSRTAMYVTAKVSHLLANLESVRHCLIFAEKGMDVADSLMERHSFLFSEFPQADYARYASRFEQMKRRTGGGPGYIQAQGGYYVSETARIGRDAYIEPGCLIGHDVSIGDRAVILAGSVIRHASVGDDFLCNEYAVIGANGFTMAEDAGGNRIRIPSLGRVRIGNRVEAGVHSNISRGSAGDTVLEDGVKLDAFVHIGHDAHVMSHAQVTAGVVVGGYAVVGEGAFLGINASVRNRISIGDHATAGMGAVITKSVPPDSVSAGNPASRLKRSI